MVWKASEMAYSVTQNIRYLTERLKVSTRRSRPSEGKVIVYQMMSISFLNCLMHQDRGGDL